MKATYAFAIAAVVSTFAGIAARADLIVQKDGSVIEGKVVTRNTQGLTIQPDGAATLPKIDIAADKIDRVVVIDEHGAETAEAAGISAPAKRPDPQWDVPKDPAAPPITPAPAGPSYYLIPLHGVVGETVLADALDKSLADAAARKPTVVVLDIDSPGGMVAEAEQMMKTLHKFNKTLRIVALVDQDLSAAAITSLSAKTIYMKSTGTIGAATAFNATNPDMPQDIQEKMQSVWRAVARNSAEEGGHDPLLAEAMIDSSKELHLETIDGKKTIVEGPGPHTIVSKGKILTLTSHEAEDCGLTAGIADDLDELADELSLKGWKECPGFGTVLADFLPKRHEAFVAKAQELEATLKDNLAGVKANAPTEEIVTQRIVTGGLPVAPTAPGARPGVGGARGGIGGARGGIGMGAGGARGGAVGPSQPQRVVTQQVVTVSPEQRAQWKNHSLATVAALQLMEQNIRDEISLSLAFGQKGAAEQLKDPLSALAEVRAKVYADRNKYAGEAASSAAPLAVGPSGRPSSPTTPAAPGRPAPVTITSAPPLALKNASLPGAFADLAGRTVNASTYKIGPTYAGTFARDEFQDIASDGGILIGLRCGTRGEGKSAVVTAVQPVYLTKKGVALGKIHGDPNASPVVDLIARDGYALGGATIGGGINLEGLSLKFMRIKNDTLDPTDAYETDYIGNFSPPTKFDATTGLVGITGRTNSQAQLALGFVFLPTPLTVKRAPLAGSYADLIKQAVARKSYKSSQVLGGDPARTNFDDMAPDGGLLIGLRCGVGKSWGNDVVTSVQPIYLTPKGVIAGKIHGDSNALPVIDLVARDGYAVGGAQLTGGQTLGSLTLTFMRIAGESLDPSDSYQSDKVGSATESTPEPFASTVVGITGRTDDHGQLGVAFVYLPRPVVSQNAPLAVAFSNTLKQAVAKKSYAPSKVIGGGFARETFEDLAPDGGVLIGFRYGMGKFVQTDIVVSLQPIFLTPKGVVLGETHGNPDVLPVIDVIARNGYAIGGAKLGGTANLEYMALTFMRIADGKLDPKDAYSSEDVGNPNAPNVTTLALSSPVIGINGKANTSGSVGLALVSINDNSNAANRAGVSAPGRGAPPATRAGLNQGLPSRGGLAAASPPVPTISGGKSGADIRWENLENGCTITQDGGKFHVVGTTAVDGWGHSNGVRTAEDFPDGDFTVSVDFKVPEFSGGTQMTYFRVSSDDGNMAALLFQGGNYQLQRWTPRSMSGNLRSFGDEKTAFHHMTLQYDAAAKSLSAWVDDKFVGKADATLSGKRKFWLDANTNAKDTKIDLYFENFTLMLGTANTHNPDQSH